MSLRVRLIASIVLMLFVSLCIGGLVAGWHASRSVQTEMQAALNVGEQTLRNGLDEVENAADPDAELIRLVHILDGDRHIRAVLRDAAGHVQLASRVRAFSSDVPAWFVALLSPALTTHPFRVDADRTIALETDPRNEISEVWTQLKDDLIAIGLFCTLSVVLVSLVVRQALRPLDRLSTAFASLGAGEYAVRVEQAGPPELARLAQGLNAMAERLDAARARNFRLNEQLLTLQEEERADLARDLHDEIGPFLFAVNLDAAAIEQAAGPGEAAAISERARAIRDSVGHMQRHVRAMLHRLRPASPVAAGLAAALNHLVDFWRARRPAIDFSLTIALKEDALANATTEAIYRLVQESLSNAVRHGRPGRIAVVVALEDSGDVLVQVTDDGIGLVVCQEPGLGLTGMHERVETLGGTLHYGAGEDGRGMVVTARLRGTAVMEEA